MGDVIVIGLLLFIAGYCIKVWMNNRHKGKCSGQCASCPFCQK